MMGEWNAVGFRFFRPEGTGLRYNAAVAAEDVVVVSVVAATDPDRQ